MRIFSLLISDGFLRYLYEASSTIMAEMISDSQSFYPFMLSLILSAFFPFCQSVIISIETNSIIYCLGEL